jgi:thymidine kinase
MAKLFFRYSSMGAGKSLDLLKTCYNYEEHGKKVLIFTSSKDDRYGENKVKSRTGLEKEAISVNDEYDIYEYIKGLEEKPNCILVDEVQFLKKHHILQLTNIVDKLDIPVIAYGLRTDFKLDLFEGSSYLLALADEIEELKTLCNCCEKKAILNIRYSIKEGTIGKYKKIMTEGAQVQIGGNDSYMPLCRKCYNELLDLTNKIEVKDTSIVPEGMYCYTIVKPTKNGHTIKTCPYFDRLKDADSQENGYCHFLEKGDNTEHQGLLWNMCKDCGINDDISEEDLRR